MVITTFYEPNLPFVPFTCTSISPIGKNTIDAWCNFYVGHVQNIKAQKPRVGPYKHVHLKIDSKPLLGNWVLFPLFIYIIANITYLNDHKRTTVLWLRAQMVAMLEGWRGRIRHSIEASCLWLNWSGFTPCTTHTVQLMVRKSHT